MAILYSVTRNERAAEVARLLAAGRTKREVADELGISLAYVRDLVWDPDGTKLAARLKRYEGVCEDCGGPTRNGHNTKVAKVCDPCYRKRRTPEHGTRSRYGSGCRCDACKGANRDEARARKGRPPKTHGHSGYTNYGCRCEVCRDGFLVYMRKVDHGRRFAQPWQKRQRGKEPPKHGTKYAYEVFACRCEVCKAAMRPYWRERYKRQKGRAAA